MVHYIADCPQFKNKQKDDERYKEKSKDYITAEDSNKECIATLAIPNTTPKYHERHDSPPVDHPSHHSFLLSEPRGCFGGKHGGQPSFSWIVDRNKILLRPTPST